MPNDDIRKRNISIKSTSIVRPGRCKCTNEKIVADAVAILYDMNMEIEDFHLRLTK